MYDVTSDPETPMNWTSGFSTEVTALAKRIRLEADTFRAIELTDTENNVRTESVMALSALKYINTLVSPSLRHWAPTEIANEYDGQRILSNGVGICGQQVEAMVALCDALKLPVRMVQMSWTHNGAVASHVACEVKAGPTWCYMDVSFGSVASRGSNIYNMTSLADIIIELDELHILESTWDPWRFQWIKNFGDPIKGLPEAENWDVTFDGSGTVFVPFRNGVADFAARNSFIGLHGRNHGRFGNNSVAFDVPEDMDMEVEFGGASFYDGKAGTLVARDVNGTLVEHEVTRTMGTIVFNNINSCLHLSIQTLDICTLVIQSARLVPKTTV